MSTSIKGIIPSDGKFLKMKAIYELCEEQGIEIPEEVEVFFGGEKPGEQGAEVYLKNTDAVVPYNNSKYAAPGFDVHLDKLPKDIKIIRFYNSW